MSYFYHRLLTAKARDDPLMPGWPAYAAVPGANHSIALNRFQYYGDRLPQLAGRRLALILFI
jgi:hypothetical protein